MEGRGGGRWKQNQKSRMREVRKKGEWKRNEEWRGEEERGGEMRNGGEMKGRKNGGGERSCVDEVLRGFPLFRK